MREPTVDMRPSRLESFSDAVIAVIITIMVLDLRTPHGATLASLKPAIPTLVVYAVSFSQIATFWSNHHHLIRSARRVTPSIIWSNLVLLFWLSLIPFVVSWVGEFHARNQPWPTACFGVLLLLAGGSYNLLQNAIVKGGGNAVLSKRIGNNTKGVLSLSTYAVAIALAFVSPWLSYGLFAVLTLMWVIPDKRLVPTE